MISPDDLHEYLSKDGLTRADLLLTVLAAVDGTPMQVAAVKNAAIEAGLHAAKKWNISDILSSSAKGLAVRKPEGWILTNGGRKHLDAKGIPVSDPHVVSTQSSLRKQLNKIKSADTMEFVEEAVACFETMRHRSAVVLSWQGAISLLYDEVVSSCLPAFNAEAIRRNPKWKPAKTRDDLGRMREHDFLDVLQAISVIGQNVKQQLQQSLKLRNACGHPNSLKIAEHSVAAHLEVIILNVFVPFG